MKKFVDMVLVAISLIFFCFAFLFGFFGEYSSAISCAFFCFVFCSVHMIIQ